MHIVKEHRCFDGAVRFYRHPSEVTGVEMRFSTFAPRAPKGALIWLSGLTCTDENFMAKAGAPRALAEAGWMVICPDTSPRGLQLPGEHETWDFGSGASFYVDALTPGYRDHYRMYSYITRELYALAENEFGMAGRISISGHSMGGHGALVMGLREKGKFNSVSALAPIANPMQSAWGKKAFTGYLGNDEKLWREYDATELILSGSRHPRTILLDQGDADEYYPAQLRTANFEAACRAQGQPLESRLRQGYDHGYYFISSFIAEHVHFHAQF